MNIDVRINELRDIVRRLAATGDEGFEGLMALVLTEVTRTTFSLAKSGSQHGKDGQSTLDTGSIAFEGKRYDDTVPKTEVLSKIAEIAANNRGTTDLWILGSTAPVRTQDIDTINALGEQFAIGILILDWSGTGLPSFATLLAMAPAQAASFLAPRTGVSESDILVKLDAVRSHGQFADRVRELTAVIEQPSIGPAYALKQNDEFLKAVFGSTRRAKAVFGQALAPGDTSVPGILDRAALRDRLATLAFGKPGSHITVLLGADGNGKSWLFGQSWLRQKIKPLTIVLIPDDIKEPATLAEIEKLLVTALIRQTGDGETEIAGRKWRKHFARWKNFKAADRPRLVVFMDGLNQRQSIQWLRVINALGEILEELGGNLVLSCRTPFFRSNLKDRILDSVRTVEVPEWTNPELETLLNERGTSIDKLKPNVVEFLRNPRIFAVAADLFQHGKIEGFTELSVSRLLFEHIRAGTSPVAEPLSAADFVRGVREHADQVVKRLVEAGRTDLQIFARPSMTSNANASFSDQLAIISAGRFFEEVPGDATLYSLKDDSLPLALGLSLLSAAQLAQRNGLGIAGELSKILDPISALDITAEVLISALIAAVLGEGTSAEIISALAAAFVSLQNLDGNRFPEFRALVRSAALPFLQALENATLEDGVTANLSWLITALLESRNVPQCWNAMSTLAQRWLSMYSLAPERRMHGQHPAGSEEREKAYQKRKNEIDGKLASFSPAEKSLFSSMIAEERGDYTKLNRTAFQFLAARPLAQFGTALRNWCLAECLNGGFHSGDDEFNNLVQFNRVDWQQTRAALLNAAEPLRTPEASRTGRWALVYLLRATADLSDAKEAQDIWEDLIKDLERHAGWRLVETWCATDPCDPASERPENIEATAKKYTALDVAELKKFREMGKEDLFFDEARAGLARFEPSVAIATMRRLGADVAKRDILSFQMAAFFLEDHTAALEDDAANLFVTKASEIAAAAITGEDKYNELFVASQYALMIAFPHMSGDEQLDALMAYPKINNILLSLCDYMQGADASKFEAALEKAYADGDIVNQFRLMAFGERTETKITDRAKSIIGKLTISTNDLVRLCALGVLRRLEDTDLLKAVVDSGWNANSLDSASATFESWQGSEVLILAAGKNLISVESCIDRVAFSAFQSLIRRVGKDAIPIIVSRIDAALQKAAGYTVSTALPDIEQPLTDSGRPMLYSVEERPDPNGSVQNAFERANETGDAWYERQLRLRKTVEKFEQELTAAGAQLIVKSVTAELVAEIYKEAPEAIHDWYNYLMALDEQTLSRLHNVALPIAQIIAVENQAGAAALFDKLTSSNPLVRITVGRGRVSLDAVTVWSAGDGNEMRELRFKRLDHARNDHELASEVLAALDAGKVDALREYVLDRHTRPEPSHIARAIMVSALCDDVPWALNTINAHKDDNGFLFDTYKAAKYAMDRRQWSKHWAKMMGNATNETDLWRYAILLAEIVDGRFRSDDVEKGSNYNLMRRYGTSFNDLIRRRIDKWKSKREKTLFGKKAPNQIFLA